MSIFSKRGQVNPPEDLDQGYDHGYYQQTEHRPADRDRNDRNDRNDRYDRYEEDRDYDRRDYDRRDERRDDRRQDDRYQDSRDDRRQDDRYEDNRYGDRRGDDRYEEDEYVARPTRRRDSVYEEDDAPGYTERTREDRRRNAAPARPQNKGTEYFTPETCQDCREDIVCDLADGHAVVVGLGSLDAKNMTRLLDYIMGAVQALGADIRRLEGNYILLSPAGVEVTDDEIELPEEEVDEDYDNYEDEGEMYDEVVEED